MEVGTRVSLQVATKGSIRDKKTLKIQIFSLFFSSKNGGVRPKSLNYFDQFGITIPCSATYFLEVGACFSLKVATKGSIRDKKDSEELDFYIAFLK